MYVGTAYVVSHNIMHHMKICTVSVIIIIYASLGRALEVTDPSSKVDKHVALFNT